LSRLGRGGVVWLVCLDGTPRQLVFVCLDAGFYECCLKVFQGCWGFVRGRRVSAGPVAFSLLPKIPVVCFAGGETPVGRDVCERGEGGAVSGFSFGSEGVRDA
jgi:hypothetical protein